MANIRHWLFIKYNTIDHISSFLSAVENKIQQTASKKGKFGNRHTGPFAYKGFCKISTPELEWVPDQVECGRLEDDWLRGSQLTVPIMPSRRTTRSRWVCKVTVAALPCGATWACCGWVAVPYMTRDQDLNSAEMKRILQFCTSIINILGS